MTSKQFIYKYRKRLVSGMDFYNPDTCLMTVEQYEKAKCRILIVFPTPHANKNVSSTAAALNDYVIEHCPDTFIDFAYMPEGSDVSLYDEYNMPYAIGNITHLDPSHFDIVGFSISVLSDIISAPVQLKSFERCEKPIPLFWSDRKDLPLGQHPLIIAGGITLAVGDVLYGKVNGKESFLDFSYLGECQRMNVIFNRYIESIEKGYCTRHQEDHDVNGVPHKDIENFQEVFQVKTVQDFINAQFDCPWIYQAQAYEVLYNKRNQIISNKKINPYAQDWVQPYYPHKLHEDLGIGRTIICANGEMAGTAQTEISNGCSASGACSFAVAEGTRIWTPEGLVRIEDYKGTLVQGVASNEQSKGVQEQKTSNAVKVVTEDGHTLICDMYHKFMVVSGDSLVEKRTNELLQGDVILRRLNAVDTNIKFDEDFAELLGFLHGDGCFGEFYSKRSRRVKIFMTDAELVRYEPLFRKYFKVTASTRVHYKSEKITIYVIEANLPDFGYDIAAVSSSDLYVPECIFKASHSAKRAYLRGIFQADGWFTKDLGLTSVSERYIHDISLLLSAVGIDSTVSKNEFFERSPLEGHKCSYYCLVSKAYQQKFIDDIGFVTKSHSVTSVGNKTKAHLKNTPEVQSYFISKYSRQEVRSMGIGALREEPYNNISDYLWRKVKNEALPQGVRAMVSSGDFVTDTIQSVVVTTEQVRMYDVVATESNLCVYNDILTHNCSEGNYSGGWVEKSQERVLWESRECKKYSAGYKYKPYSFNSNYYTDYKGMLKKWVGIYPKVSFINMRMEELGRDVDAIRMMRLIGSNRIASPLEGLSPRIQNNLLNKCLSTESLTNFMEEMVHSKLTDIKVGAIYTGMEEDEDFQWMYDFIKRLKQKANDEGGRFPIRINMTPLVHYPLTPLEFVERKTAYRSYKEQRWFTDEWYNKYREVNMRVKVHGFRFSTFVEQSIVDLGRALTPLIYKHFVSTVTPIYTLRSVVTKEFVEDLKNFIDPETHFADRDPEHYISPCHRIHIELMGSYIPRARRLLQYKRAGRIFDNPSDERCLKTYEGAHTTCQKKCIFNKPLIIYNDVTMDENGNLHGDGRPLEGCERCISNEERKNRLARPIVSTANTDDIIATPRIPQVQKIRFLLYRKPEYDLYSANATSHTFITKFLQKSDTLLDAYHSVITHNMFWQSEPIYKSFISGFQIVDTMWSKNVINEVKSLINEVNDSLIATKVISVEEVLRDEKLDVSDYNIYYFESTLPKEYFDSAKINYNGEIKVDVGTSAAITLETHQDPALKNVPLFFASKGKVCGAFALPLKFSPTNFLSSYLSTVKRVGIDTLVETTTISCELTVRENLNACRNCGKEHAVISLSTGKPMSFGVSCLCKALLTQKLKNV